MSPVLQATEEEMRLLRFQRKLDDEKGAGLLGLSLQVSVNTGDQSEMSLGLLSDVTSCAGHHGGSDVVGSPQASGAALQRLQSA